MTSAINKDVDRLRVGACYYINHGYNNYKTVVLRVTNHNIIHSFSFYKVTDTKREFFGSYRDATFCGYAKENPKILRFLGFPRWRKSND